MINLVWRHSILQTEKSVIDQKLLHMRLNLSALVIMNSKKIISECNCIGCSKKVIRIVQQHFRIHSEANCIIHVLIERLVRARKLLSETDAGRSERMKNSPSFFCLHIIIDRDQLIIRVVQPIILTRRKCCMLSFNPRMIVPLHSELPPCSQD